MKNRHPNPWTSAVRPSPVHNTEMRKAIKRAVAATKERDGMLRQQKLLAAKVKSMPAPKPKSATPNR